MMGGIEFVQLNMNGAVVAAVELKKKMDKRDKYVLLLTESMER